MRILTILLLCSFTLLSSADTTNVPQDLKVGRYVRLSGEGQQGFLRYMGQHQGVLFCALSSDYGSAIPSQDFRIYAQLKGVYRLVQSLPMLDHKGYRCVSDADTLRVYQTQTYKEDVAVDPKDLVLTINLAITAIQEKLRSVVPPSWEVEQETGTSAIKVKRKEYIPPKELTIRAIPCAGLPAMSDASAKGILVWFYIEPVGACSDAEYKQRKAKNAEVRAQQEILARKISQIPSNPHTKPSLLARIPRNDEDKALLSEYEKLSNQLKIQPTHRTKDEAFCVTLVQDYWGATINNAAVLAEIDNVKKAIETVLVPYETAEDGKAENTLELKDGYQYGPANKEASEAFALANDFIKHEKDLRRFLITQPSVSRKDEGFEVRYKLLTKSEESEAIVRVDLQAKK